MSTTTTGAREEFPPLWPPGLHSLSLSDVCARCVTTFPLSKSRTEIFAAFKSVVDKLERLGCSLDIWLDGSFATEKIDPVDIDFVAVVDAVTFESWSAEQRQAVEDLVDAPTAPCDTSLAIIYPTERSNSVELLAFWQKRLGYSSDGLTPKGIVVITVGTGRAK